MPLQAVAVADGEQPALHVDAEVDGDARAQLGGVHVAAVRVGGVIDMRTSFAPGATPTVPCMGSSGRSTLKSLLRAW
ncbi:hypothetical protein GCM10020001_073400 [Nonomuraea salmonea]